MRWLWLTAFFTTFFWLHTVRVYTRGPGSYMWFIVPAVLAAGLGLRRAAARGLDARWLMLLVPVALSIWAVPFPYSVAPAMLSVAALLLACVPFSPNLAWVGVPLGAAGMVLAFQAAAFPLLYILSSRVHEVPSLTPFLYGLVRLFHPGAALSENAIVINYVYDVFEFPTRLEALGIMPAGLFAVAGVALLAVFRRPLKTVLGFLAFLAGYSALRYVLLVFLTVRLKTASVFWLPEPIILSYVPLAVALFFIPWFGGSAAAPGFRAAWPGARRWVPALVLVTLGVAGIIGAFAYHDAGAPKAGRLLVDELHSDWEWTTEEYDTEWYGRRSGYNYYSLAEYLKHYFHVEVASEPLLADLLSGYDIVMLKTPTKPFSAEEIDALVEFVDRGGGLWLLGDHTNVFGTSTYLNQLTGRFGLRLRYDSTYDLRTMGLSLFERPEIFPHPTVAFMPPYLFATSCSMEAPYFSENMILGYGLKTMELDYSQTSFFPKKDSRNYSFGVFVQQGGVRFGKGRVAIFTDSTCFSNFFMFIPGKPELALATLEWLNRSNRRGWANRVLPALGLAGLVAAALIMRRWTRGQKVVLGLAAGFAGLALAIAAYDSHVRASYPLPEPHTDYVSVAFDGEHSGFNLPTRGLTRFPETSLHTFYVWTQRLGLFPSFEPTLEGAISRGDLVVIARPLTSLEPGEAGALLDYVEGGGRLLIIVDSRQAGQPTADLLNLFEMGLVSGPEGEHEDEPEAGGETADEPADGPEAGTEGEPQDEPEGVKRPYIVTPEGRKIVPAASPVGLTGGTPRLLISDGRTVLSEKRLGKGRVFVFSDFYLLTTEIMGHTGITPNARQRSISELEYYMLRDILEIPQSEPYWE